MKTTIPILTAATLILSGCASIKPHKALHQRSKTTHKELHQSSNTPQQALHQGLITPEEALRQGLALSPEHFAKTASVQDDALDTIATISTKPGFQVKQGVTQQVIDDNWLRALIKKKTGVVTYEVMQMISYSGQWRLYNQVNYETPAGPKSKPVMVIDRKADCETGAACVRSEVVAFTVPKSLLQSIAKEGKTQAVAWQFKFAAKHGKDFKTWMSSAEIAGLIKKAAHYKFHQW